MTKSSYLLLFVSLMLLGMLLAACGASAAPVATSPSATSAPTAVPKTDVIASTEQPPRFIEFYTDW
ncbi:MAG: hypothetical protein DSY55_05920 [Clostridia bacterium]|nr:MAG: hypothetical protein DSY55_05920 [Clostridia bacterium]